ncbi:scavenger receptor class F member 2-like, partial [Biomphalaria glabrata]|uniref:Scavenger receptor class F member 2-like n=1 Tax=Biomphalaria glabrata TaxID=6526 RepID=A0A9W3AEQ3_BIOGL
NYLILFAVPHISYATEKIESHGIIKGHFQSFVYTWSSEFTLTFVRLTFNQSLTDKTLAVGVYFTLQKTPWFACQGQDTRYYTNYIDIFCQLSLPIDEVNITIVGAQGLFIPDIGISEECPKGTYGQFCILQCPAHCRDQTCHLQTGHCDTCKPGYQGPYCDIKCLPAFYGENCLHRCRDNCFNRSCDPITGFCIQCRPGSSFKMCPRAVKSIRKTN